MSIEVQHGVGGELKRVRGRTYKNRGLSFNGNTARTLSSEDGLLFRGIHQEMNPIFERIDYLNHMVNDAPRRNNKNDWGYLGSIPWAVLIEFCAKERIGLDQFARNENDERAKLQTYVKQNYPQFMTVKKRSESTILMPGSKGTPIANQDVKIEIPAGAKTA